MKGLGILTEEGQEAVRKIAKLYSIYVTSIT